MPKKERDFIPLNDLLKRELYRLADGKIKNTVTLESRWRAIVGDTVAQNAKVLYVKNKILHVGVKSSPWLYELGFMRENILREIDSQLPDLDVEEIRFKIVE